MPKSDSPEAATSEIEKLFLEIIPHIPAAVRQVCQSLNHHPDDMEFDGLVSRIMLLLMDNDFHTLRSFENSSKLQTWLYTIARRQILRQLRKRKKEVHLEDLPPDSLTIQPDQEEKLLSEEREKLLQTAVSKLSEHDRKLLHLVAQKLSAEEIAEEMNIKRESVYPEKSDLLKKLRKIIGNE